MYARLTLIALFGFASLPAVAADPANHEIKVRVTAETRAYVTPEQLALETGLNERQVRMMLGPRSSYAEYRMAFERTQRRFREALGEDRYQDLRSGRPIELYHQANVEAARRDLVADAARDGEQLVP
ncbi:MAG: hypothetical protein GX856_13710 [Gammaproteobacteria bacterium]|jgi:uncharacterized protein (DUF39 family)|nr:hypothetical protein [Gammaproteobacteria bacterium]